MASHLRIVAALAFAVSLSGCLGVLPGGGGPADHPAEPAYPGDIDDVSVRLQTGPCNGDCPVFSVEVCGNGTVYYVGYDHVDATGLHTYQVPRSNVSSLLNASYRIDFFALDRRYAAQASDLPTVTTTVVVGEDSHSVEDYGPGWNDAPEDLVAFESRVVNATGVGRLVEGGDDSLADDRAEELYDRGSFCS